MNTLPPSQRRMRDFLSRIPLPAWHPKADPIAQAHLERLARMDIAVQAKIRELDRRLPLFLLLRMQGGSGLRMASMLRHFFLEYVNRITQTGPHSLPSSFNVVEAFLFFNEDFMLFDLRQEREHLLRLHDYFDWYTAEQAIPDDPKILVDIMQEGVTYSFDVAGDTGEYAISTEGSRLAIGGVSMVRHENELTTMLLAAENPPYPPDSDIVRFPASGSDNLLGGKKGVSPDPSLSVQDRYFEGMKGFSKVLLLTRFDLDSRRHDVRYIQLDIGRGYEVLTDHIDLLVSSIPEDEREETIKHSLDGLKRYGQLYSALASLIYLPVMFIAEVNRVVETTFMTELTISKQKHYVRKARKEFGKQALELHRNIRCLTSSDTENLIIAGSRVIDPPEFTFESTGFWKPVGANEIGEDRAGNPIVGKTWVERTESYAVKSPESFVINNEHRIRVGNDPGIVYIMRTPAHGNDLYKVGITRRTTHDRAAELGSSTGVPLPFEVLASWKVSDCGAIEKDVHKQLKQYRLSKRREFFRTTLSSIVAAVEQAIASIEDSS